MGTKKGQLESRVSTLNLILERPATPMGLTTYNVGHIFLEETPRGYSILEYINVTGDVRDYGTGLTAKEVNITIQGIIYGIALRNAHIGNLLLRNKLQEAGLSGTDSPLYG